MRTDVAGFVGIAERGPVGFPLPVESWHQFASLFGGFLTGGFLAYAVRAFFENGGRRAYIVRVASDDPATGHRAARASCDDGAGHPVWEFLAASSGVWGNRLEVRLIETHVLQTRSIPARTASEVPPEGTLRVLSVSGFERGTLVRLSQAGATHYRVVAESDIFDSLLRFRADAPERRLAYPDTVPYVGAGALDPARPIEIESVEYTLAVTEKGNTSLYERLALIEEHARYAPQFLLAVGAPVLIREERDLDARQRELRRPAAGTLALASGRDGLAGLSVFDFIGEPFAPRDSDDEWERKARGLQALEEVAEVRLLCLPDVHTIPQVPPAQAPPRVCLPNPCLPGAPTPPAPLPVETPLELPPRFADREIFQVQEAMIQQCERLRDRFALLDAPASSALDAAGGLGAIRDWRNRFDSAFAALYYPWIEVIDPLRGSSGLTRRIPPCGHVAGQFARTDTELGVHRAAANVALGWAQRVTLPVDEALHGVLNPLGVNAIRALPGRGLRLMGARTTSSDPDWRFVPVRRLMSRIEQALRIGLQWAAFEPNNELLWIHLRLAVTGLLDSFFQQGALAGATQEEAFFVRCDATNNPPAERELGHLHMNIGIAPTTPLEFILVRVGRVANAFEVTGGVG